MGGRMQVSLFAHVKPRQKTVVRSPHYPENLPLLVQAKYLVPIQPCRYGPMKICLRPRRHRLLAVVPGEAAPGQQCVRLFAGRDLFQAHLPDRTILLRAVAPLHQHFLIEG